MTADHQHTAKYPTSSGKKEYKRELHDQQVELVKRQKHVVPRGDRVLLLFEGHDSGGKDGTIKRAIRHRSPHELCVVALGEPTDRDRAAWYLRRDTLHLDCRGKAHSLIRPDPDSVFTHAGDCLKSGMTAP